MSEPAEGEREDVEPQTQQNVKHEINNALAAIIGHAQLIQLRGELDDKSRERVAKIEEIANRLNDFAAELKD